jgi:ParB family chromosome partitioning protein
MANRPKKTSSSFWANAVDIPLPANREASSALGPPAVEAPLRPSVARISSAPSQLAGLVLDEHSARLRLAKFEDAEPTRMLDSERIRFSTYANRLEARFQDAEFEELKQTIQAAGVNVQPVAVRPIQGDPEHDYEVIFGHRRVRACQALKLKVLALVREYTDAQLLDAMSRENLARANLSLYEWGRHFQAILRLNREQGPDTGLPQTQKQLAAAYGVTESSVSQALTCVELPTEVLECIAEPHLLGQRDVQALARAKKQDEADLLARAATLKAEPPLPTAQAVRRLLGLEKGRATAPAQLEVNSGQSKGRVWVEGDHVRFQVSAANPTPERLGALRDLLQSWLASP